MSDTSTPYAVEKVGESFRIVGPSLATKLWPAECRDRLNDLVSMLNVAYAEGQKSGGKQ